MYGNLTIATLAVILGIASEPNLVSASDDANKASGAMEGYSSPEAAFRAFRNARQTGNWRTVLLSLSEDSRDGAVFAAYVDGQFSLDPKAAETGKKYGLAQDLVMADYIEKYRQKHGVDLLKINEERSKIIEDRKRQVASHNATRPTHPAVPDSKYAALPALPAVDAQLLGRVVARRVTDRVAFFEEMNSVLYPQENVTLPLPAFGELKDLAVSADTAVGRVSVTGYHLRFAEGKQTVEPDPSTVLPVHFVKVRGRWFLGAPPRP